MAVSPKRKLKGIIDDTTPMICNIEAIEKKEHVDYIMRVQRGINPDDSWQVAHRYSDFATMHSILEVSGIELPLPPKKVFGNMDAAFIAERQQGLQNYINIILAHPLLVRHISVKKFLDPANYSCDFQEKGTQNVAMFLRSVPNWEIVATLSDVGWRIRKQFFLIKPTDPTKKNVRNILTWVKHLLYAKNGSALCPRTLNLAIATLNYFFFLYHLFFQHPYIYPPSFTTCNSEGIITVRNFLMNGTLRDSLCNVSRFHFWIFTSLGNHLILASSYTMRFRAPCITFTSSPLGNAMLLDVILSIFETQLCFLFTIQGLKFLYEKGIPYGHLHSGNVALDGNVCRLLEIETGLIGVPSIHRHRYVPMKKIQDIEAQDVYSFARLLYEMLCGEPLRSSTLQEVPPNCSSELKSILLSILSDEACNKSGLPTFADLLANPYFTAIDLPSIEKPQLKIPSKLKEVIKTAKERSEARLKEDQKFSFQLQKEASISESSQTSAPPSSPSPASRNHVSVPPPPQSSAPSPPPSQAPANKSSLAPKTEGRGALLSSICDFKKGELKKTKTVDKSKPRV
ncbi:PREDICTED: PX domain-containing protein kinase-like protein [Acropora digitifera]|uniref:PX domain-containing protein kinase-like protein n=1 Tax=Acropora digitifera TaxID=70779 RepID=UPI00077AC5AF|nr:PREDICTED: PX domain-containing protein kinase-like protein [Acropora digitifera]